MADSIRQKRSKQSLPNGYPNPVLVPYEGTTYKLFWHAASGGYRLRVQGLPQRSYGPDPGQAMMTCLQELPRYLGGQIESPNKVNRLSPRPDKINVKAFGQTWTLRYHKSGYRTNRGLANYIYAGHDPLAAPDIFKQKLLAVMHPEAVCAEEPAAPFIDLQRALDEWLATKEDRVSKARYTSYKSDRNLLLDEASDAVRRLPVEEISSRQWAALQTKALDRRKSLSSRKAICQAVQEMRQLLFERHDLKLRALAGYFQREDMSEGRAALPTIMFEVEEVHQLLAVADPKWKAMVLWGINGAFEPLDLAHLQWSQVDLQSGWFAGHRMKKKRSAPKPPFRRFKLWPETIASLEEWRRESKNLKLVFPKPNGRSPYKTRKSNDSAFSGDFNALQELANVKLVDRGFYALRHSAAHLMGKAPFAKKMALDVVMGHTYGLDHIYDPYTDDRHVEYVCLYARHYLFEGREAADRYANSVIGDVGRTAWRVVGDDAPLPGKAS